jgi:hypothetical protein
LVDLQEDEVPSSEAAGKMVKGAFPRMNTEQPRSQTVQFQGRTSLRKDGLAIGEMMAANQDDEDQAELYQELMGGRLQRGNEEPLIVQLTAIPDDEDTQEQKAPSGRRKGKAPIRWEPSEGEQDAFQAALLQAKPMVALKL